jgi:hypothetical protein
MSKTATNAAPKAKKEKVAKPAKVKAVKVPKEKKETKADQARVIFTRLAGSARKDVVAAFQSEIGLSAAAAATYFQNIKKSASAPAATAATA